MRQRNFLQRLPGPWRDAVRRWLAAGLGIWLLVLQAPLPLAHFASLAGGQAASAEPARPSCWEPPAPAAGAHDPSHCLICQAFCQLLRVLVPAAAGGQPQPAAGPSLAIRTDATAGGGARSLPGRLSRAAGPHLKSRPPPTAWLRRRRRVGHSVKMNWIG